MGHSLVDELGKLKRSTVLRNARRSQDWLKNKILKGDFDKKLITSRPRLGHMYAYVYKPKHKKTLPYWDRNPLVIVIGFKPGGFLGLNLHYLAPRTRLVLLSKLKDFQTTKKVTERTRFRMTYDLLNSTKKYKEFRPTIKRYLYSYLSTKLAKIPAPDWELAIFLPTARFVGVSNTFVYAQSRKQFV